MPVFEVLQIANGYNSQAPGYGQKFEAELLGEWCASVGEPREDTGENIVVNRAHVFAENGGQAIDKYRAWLNSGEDKWSLLKGVSDERINPAASEDVNTYEKVEGLR